MASRENKQEEESRARDNLQENAREERKVPSQEVSSQSDTE